MLHSEGLIICRWNMKKEKNQIPGISLTNPDIIAADITAQSQENNFDLSHSTFFSMVLITFLPRNTFLTATIQNKGKRGNVGTTIGSSMSTVTTDMIWLSTQAFTKELI